MAPSLHSNASSPSEKALGGLICDFKPRRVPRRDLPLYFESDDVQIAGLVVSNYSADPSHWASQQSLGNWLAKAGVPAIFGADSA